jgi:hypothetical protein
MFDSIHYSGADFFLAADELHGDLLDALVDCGAPGQDASEAVAYVLKHYTVTGDKTNCADYLKGFGAWDDEELADHEENLRRLVWLTGCGLREDSEVYFSAY